MRWGGTVGNPPPPPVPAAPGPSPSPLKGGEGSSGFTLLELLVALAVFSLLVVGLTQGLRFGIQGWGAQSRETRKLAELDSVDRLLRNVLSSIQVRPSAAFAGEPHQLRFVGLLPRAAPPAIRLETISLLVTRDGFLALSWTPPTIAKTAVPVPPTVTPILDHVAGIEIGYYGGAQTGREKSAPKPSWRPRWDDGGGLPTMIRVHIDFVESDPRRWPDFVIAPMVGSGGDTGKAAQRPRDH